MFARGWSLPYNTNSIINFSGLLQVSFQMPQPILLHPRATQSPPRRILSPFSCLLPLIDGYMQHRSFTYYHGCKPAKEEFNLQATWKICYTIESTYFDGETHTYKRSNVYDSSPFSPHDFPKSIFFCTRVNLLAKNDHIVLPERPNFPQNCKRQHIR